MPFGEATSDWILAAGNVMFCRLHERGGLRIEKGTQVSGRLLAASALCAPLTAIPPLTGAFSAALAPGSPGKSTTSRLPAGPGFSLLPGHSGPAAALHS